VALYTSPLEGNEISLGPWKTPVITVRKHAGSNEMAHYRLADIVAQEIPDTVLVDIALHWQANDNCQPSIGASRVSHQNNQFYASAQRAGFGYSSGSEPALVALH
jgi:hypothetical protein